MYARIRHPHKRKKSMMLIYVSVAILIAGIGLMIYNSITLKRSRIVEGKVVELIPVISKTHSGHRTTYNIKAVFKAINGCEYTYQSGWSSSSTGYNVNDKIRLYYDEQSPENNGIASFGYTFGSASVVILIGLLLFGSGMLFRYGDSIMDAYFPITDAPPLELP